MQDPNAHGMAGLSVCESLILSLIDKGVLTRTEAEGLLEDAQQAHLHFARSGADSAMHREAAALIEAIRNGRDAVRGGPRG